MEAITGLVLLLLSSVGARNIPVYMDPPSAWPLVFDGPSSFKKNPFATIFPAGELVQSVDYVADIGLPLNKNNEEFENKDIHESATYKEKKISITNKKDEADGVVRLVEVIEGQKNQKGNQAVGFRVALNAGCPKGKVRVGDECMLEDKGD